MNPPDSESPTQALPAADPFAAPSPRIIPERHPSLTLARTPAPSPAAVPEPIPAGHILCEECRTPVDRDQRYCVRCGTRQTHASNPAIDYFSEAASVRRSLRTKAGSARGGRAPLYGLFFMLLPLAVGVGVLVGRGGSNDNAAVLAALRNQKPIVVDTAGTSAVPTAAAATAATAASNQPAFSTPGTGFVVKLETLPASGTTQATASAAESAATARGATQLGLISPTTTKTTPAQGAANDVVYSGFYTTQAAATQALGKLKSHFPGAAVIAVAPVTAAAAASSSSSAVTSPKSVPHTAAQIAAKPTAAALQQGAAIVKEDDTATGKNYIHAQGQLPKVITIPGNAAAGASTPSSTGAAGQP